MASDLSATPKTRSRKGGSAVPLDAFDRTLLNAMQGSFPIEPRPYAAVAKALEVPEDRVLTRVRELIDDRIIRQVTPIYDTPGWLLTFCAGPQGCSASTLAATSLEP